MRCSHYKCKNINKDVSRWELTDSRGYSCGVVCNDCHDKQKAKRYNFGTTTKTYALKEGGKERRRKGTITTTSEFPGWSWIFLIAQIRAIRRYGFCLITILPLSFTLRPNLFRYLICFLSASKYSLVGFLRLNLLIAPEVFLVYNNAIYCLYPIIKRLNCQACICSRFVLQIQ